MDIKSKIEEILAKIKEDKSFATNFKDDPVKAVESVIGIDLPDDRINAIIDGVKAKLTVDKAEVTLGKIKNLFKK